MVTEQQEKEELIELARDTAERLKVLSIKLEAFANAPMDLGVRRRITDKDENDRD
jgi:hypothetical protein